MEVTPKPREFPPLNIRVLVYELSTKELIREHTIDFNNVDRRKWLFKITLWAVQNQKYIELANERDKKLVDLKVIG